MNLNRREFGKLAVASTAALAARGVFAASPLSDMPAGAIDVHNHIRSWTIRSC